MRHPGVENEKVPGGMAAADHDGNQRPTSYAAAPSRTRWAGLLVLGLLVTRVWGAPPGLPWPSFLPPPESFPPDLAAAVERTWNNLTFTRTVAGRSARAPFDLYVALIDAPDVTAAAARFRRFAPHEVRALGEDWYEADDGDGSRGQYRVLVREPRRRVMLSWGEHSSGLIGGIRGTALTVLALEPRGAEIDQDLTAHVRIDNRVAAALARVLIVPFGRLADRRLREGFESAARVAEWAVERPEEFCQWLRQAPVPPDRRTPVLAALGGCGAR